MTYNLQEFRSFLESADLKVSEHRELSQALVVHFEETNPLKLELSLHHDPENHDQPYVKFWMPLSLQIPDQHFLHAAQAISDFNRVSPLGIFSISAESQPYFDYQFHVPSHGAFLLNLLEAIQMSFLFAGRLIEFLQHKLHEWVRPSLRSQTA